MLSFLPTEEYIIVRHVWRSKNDSDESRLVTSFLPGKKSHTTKSFTKGMTNECENEYKE